MATIVASNSVAYFVWPFGDYTCPNPVDETEYAILENDLYDGYRASIRCGFTTGVRTWKMTFPTLASLEVLPNTLTDINGALVSREQCLRSLYAENKVTGTPFVFTDPVTGVNYFVDFADENLSLDRMRLKIYVTGITLRQRRLAGVTLP